MVTEQVLMKEQEGKWGLQKLQGQMREDQK